MIPPVPGDGDGVDAVREQLVSTTRRAAAYQVALVTLATLAVIISSVTAVFVGLSNRHLNERTQDCTEPQGKCYRQTQASTAAAVQAILDYIDDAITPFRVANAAQNRCQTELFARKPTVLDKGAEVALTEYDACIARNSVGTEPPPVPPNPLTTPTTSRGGHG